MEQIFKSVLLLSSIGAILIGFLLIFKPITKRLFGSRWQYYIWFVVLVVMMLPVSFKMPVRINKTIIPQTQTIQQNPLPKENTNVQTPNNATGQATIKQPTIPISKGITISVFDVLMYAWILGALIFFFGGIISYLRFLKVIHKNSTVISCPELETLRAEKQIKRKVCVRVTELTTAPLMVGIFKATLLLPNTATSEKELHYILLHELTHLKRNDLLYKWFAMIVNSVHWFNPFIYFACRQINEECEISCDLTVTKDLSTIDKKAYMNTIIALASANNQNGKMLTTAMANSKNQIKRRFTMIKKAKKTSKFMSFISVITAVVILTTTVFASGVLANSILNDSFSISVYHGETKLEFTNKPFIQDGEVYLPLRETLNKFGIANENILWSDEGEIMISYSTTDKEGYYLNSSIKFKIGENVFTYNHDTNAPISGSIRADMKLNGEFKISNASILKNGNTYVPYELLVKANGETGMLNEFFVTVVSGNWDNDSTNEQLQMARNWAEALKTRDGKPRYDMMNEQMKGQFIENQKAFANDNGNWYYRIGVSSPWVVDYDIKLIDNTAKIVYHTTDSTAAKYDMRETVTFEKATNGLLVTAQKMKMEEYERVYAFLPSANATFEDYKKALIESNYRNILALTHNLPFDDNGEDIWEKIKIDDIKVINQDIGDDKAIFKLEINVVDNGNSAFDKGKNLRYLVMKKVENGWFVDTLATGL